ncbi:hypothetical protein HPC49_35280 [Pyxidicoccus fallax]|uniref:Uncharacterized protein n=1 Tax=Pyxidicoccus fallax TaxID=394095 RepID=A0A848LQ00_9BACT|nr:hypothetical protein [Pyxidicoccus fallax]NMO19720.1 hypothetical protein [Pyxidicoccus fallax]NPC83474.1 hypothetical protein [Pyxidicoccus fallax]
MKLIAQVSTGETQTSPGLGSQDQLSLKQGAHVSVLEISDEDGAFYLFSFDAAGRCLGDSWHRTLDEAMRQAQFQFGVPPAAWSQGGPQD